MQTRNYSPVYLAQATLLITIAILAIAAIFYQVCKTCFELGQLSRKLVDLLDGTGGPVAWLQFSYNLLSPEAFLAQDVTLTTDELVEKQLGFGAGPEQPQSLPLACSLSVRLTSISTECCLLKSKSGKPLTGNALPRRITKLQRLKVLVD